MKQFLYACLMIFALSACKSSKNYLERSNEDKALQDAVTRVFDGIEDQTTSWNTYVAEVEAF